MSGLQRVDENKLKELRQRVEDNGGVEEGALTEDEILTLSLLEDRYAVFLEEGLKKLRAASSSPRGSNGSNPLSKVLSKMSPRAGKRQSSGQGDDLVSNSDSMASGGEVGSASETPRSPPMNGSFSSAFNNSTNGDNPTINHWSWLDERVILGAIPYGAPCSDNTGHLVQLQQHCAQHSVNIGMVISCLDPEEETPEGFAGPKEWEKLLGVNMFLYFPLPADPSAKINVEFDEMFSVCSQIREVTATTEAPREEQNAATTAMKTMFGKGVPRLHRQKAAYVHCKAGRSRSWVIAMCFFISQCAMPYESAAAHIKKHRSKVSPSEAQIEYVRAFEDFITAPSPPVCRERSAEEERYLEVLASVLSLPPEFRHRLMKDLEKLT